MTPEGYDKAVPKILPAAEELAKQGANAISIMGTSLTFYKGAAFNNDLIAASGQSHRAARHLDEPRHRRRS